MMSSNKVVLEIKTSRTGQESPEAMMLFLASLANIKNHRNLLFRKIEHPISLEVALLKQTIHFFVTVPKQYQPFIESQLLAQYPKALIAELKSDPITANFKETDALQVGRMQIQSSYVYPLKTFHDFKEVDPMSPLLGLFAKLNAEDEVLVQFLLVPVGNSWQKKAQKMLEHKPAKDEEDPLLLSMYSKQIADKINYGGFKVGIKILAKSQNPSLIELIAATFITYNKVNGNNLKLQKPFFYQRKKFIASMLGRTRDYVYKYMILNTAEVASMCHFPNEKLATIRNISWTRTILSDAPENLPVPFDLTEEEKSQINFFAKTDYKNRQATFGIYKEDRRKHLYVIGKTGTGKSTFIANMAINDMRNGEGMAIIDPHGDLSTTLLDYIPSFRVNDVVYLDPSDLENSFHINPLEIENTYQKELVSSGIVSIFYKLYGNSWGPRLEYVLRNTILTLLEIPDSTLLMVPEMLTKPEFRQKVVPLLTDDVLRNFWVNEFEKMPMRLREETISPILNKVGQFLASQVIRNIVGSPKSTVNLERCMNEGKIVILNLSQGKIGEDNSALLGAMLITKLQIAAMNRVNVAEADRKDFYLYVDEFQNFATSSFVKILSEARKYRLNLILANQYIGQINEDVRLAIFGNAGTMLSFVVGAGDAPYLAKEFGERFKQEDILSLGNYQIIAKMCIQGLTSTPFMGYSLPLPQSKTQNKEKAIRISQERYCKPVKLKNTMSKPKNTADNIQEFPTTQNDLQSLGNDLVSSSSLFASSIPPVTLNSRELLLRSIN
jgi:hypothetical protein